MVPASLPPRISLISCRRQESAFFARFPAGRKALLVLTAAATALLASLQDAVAKKPDPALLIGLEAASTADIEDIVTIGIVIGGQIGRGSIGLNTKNVSTLVGRLAKAIILKPPTALTPDPNRRENKVDEIGEVAAYVFAAISENEKVTSKLGPARKYAAAVMKSALKQAIHTAGFLRTDIVADVVGSVAQTIHADPRYDVLEVKLQKTLQESATTIAGRQQRPFVLAALKNGFASDPLTSGLEYGNNQAVAQIADPETDFRNS